MTRGRYRLWFWLGAMVVGHVIPLALLWLSTSTGPLAVAALLAVIGLYAYEHAFVMAPQRVPNS
jgi:hypothetical protein